MGWINAGSGGQQTDRQKVEEQLRHEIYEAKRRLAEAEEALKRQLAQWAEEDFAIDEVREYPISDGEKDLYLIYRQQQALKWVDQDDPDFPTDRDDIHDLVDFVKVIRGKDFSHRCGWARYGELPRFTGEKFEAKAGNEL